MRFWTLLILILLVSNHSSAGCVQQDEELISGTFEVASVSDVSVRCVLDSNGITATKKTDVKVPGCKVTLVERQTRKEYSVFQSDCGLKKGKVLKFNLSTVRNMCCGVKSQFGKVRPICTKNKDIKLVQELSESERTCLGGFEWVIDKELVE